MDRRTRAGFGMLLWAVIGVSNIRAAEPDQELSALFQNWATLSQERGRDGMIVRAIQPIVGPLREQCLTQRFRWAFRSSTELEAVPVDASEAMFVPRVRITIDGDGLPTHVTVGQLTQEIRDLVKADVARIQSIEASSGDGQIVPVSFEQPVVAAPPVNARLQEILSSWAAQSQKAKAVKTAFRRVDYDIATEIESHSTGEFVYAAPRMGYYRTVPTIRPAAESARIGIEGTPFVQLPGVALSHFWSEKELIEIDSANKSCVGYPLPKIRPDGHGIASFDNAWHHLLAPQKSLPFVVGLDEKELTTNYQWQIVSETATAITLEGTPIAGPDVGHYWQAQVILDPKTCRTKATRITDLARTRETIHQFFDQVVSQDVRALGDWKPDLTALTRVGDPPGSEVSPIQPASNEVQASE